MEIKPIKFASTPNKHRKKWEKIISAFMVSDFKRLRTIQRTGTRGRIFSVLVRQSFDLIDIPYKREPIFYHGPVSAWYKEFADKHKLKLAVHSFYNPDFLLSDGCWVEVTLSENTAYKKIFRYAHQASKLLVIWLDRDEGLHKQVCEGVKFRNVTIRPVNWYYHQLHTREGGQDIIQKFETLKKLKHDIL
ncbi:MAG: hypothetical protein ACQ9MH_24910 [Nitrospinales bacterium]